MPIFLLATLMSTGVLKQKEHLSIISLQELVSCCTTDSKTCIDHVYTNLPATHVNLLLLETYFSDNKGVCAFGQLFLNKTSSKT